MSKLIVVVGVTGNQGSSVASVFASIPGWTVRGLTRDPSSSKAAALHAQGISLAQGDLDDPASLRSAFSGAHAIFGVTDFWQFVRREDVHARAAAEGRTPNAVAEEMEVAQGKNIADAAAWELAEGKGNLERFVWSTLSDTRKWSGGKYVHNHHFDGKAKVAAYVKHRLPRLAERTSWLHVGHYMDNWRGVSRLFAPMKVEGEQGVYVLRVPDVKGAYKKPWVHPPNDTGWFVKALVEKAPPGTTLLGVSWLASAEEAWRAWAEELGVEVRIEALKEDWVKERVPEFLAAEVIDSLWYNSEFSWCGGEEGVKLPEEVGVEMDKLMRWRTYVRQQDWKAML